MSAAKLGIKAKATCVLFLPLLLSLTGCQRSPQAKHDRFLASGKKLLEHKDYSRAMLDFRNAIQAMPGDAEAYYQLGLALAGSNDPIRAAGAYRRALELDPHHRQAQFQLAGLMGVYGDRASAEEGERQLRSLLDGSADDSTLNILAFTDLRLGRTEEAAKYLQQATARFPGRLASALLLAEVKMGTGDIKGAEDALKQLVLSSPQNLEGRTLLAAFYQSQHRLAQAEQVLREALAIKGDSGLVLRQMASLDQALGKNTEAEQIYKRLSVYSEDEYKPLYALYLFEAGRRAEAIQEFERLYRKNPRDRQTRTRLIAAYNTVNRTADAEEVLADALRKNPKDLDAKLQRGELFLNQKQYAKAEADLNEVEHRQPNSPQVHYLLAKLSQARGKMLIYRQELVEALRLDPALLAVRLELAQNLGQANDAKSALDLLRQAPGNQKQLPELLTQQNWAFWTLGNLPEMRQGIDLGLAQQRTPELLLQDGLYKLRTGNAQDAQKSLEEALRIDPSDILALRALNQSYQALRRAPTALAKAKEYAAREPQSAAVQEFLGELLSGSGDLAGARAAFSAAKADSPGYIQADLALVRLDAIQGKWDDAQKRLEAAAKTDSATTVPRVWLAVIEEARGQNDKAIEDYRRVVDRDPNQAEALNNLAYLLAEHSHNLEEALKYAQRAVERDPTRPSYADTLGWILYQKGLYSSALPYLEKAGSATHVQPSAARSAVWKYHLAMAYAKAGDKERSHTTLEAALKIDSKLPEAKMARDVVGNSH